MIDSAPAGGDDATAGVSAPDGGPVSVWVAVLFRGLSNPKRRLASWTSDEYRRRFARAMLDDVLLAVQRTAGLERRLLVTAEASLEALAHEHGFELLADSGRGYRQAAVQVARKADVEGGQALLVLPADLPCLTPAALGAIVAAGRRAEVVLAASRDGRGTNAILTRPPGAIPYLFGPESFARHREAALRRGLAVAEVSDPALSSDVDSAIDLSLLRQEAERAGPATLALLGERWSA